MAYPTHESRKSNFPFQLPLSGISSFFGSGGFAAWSSSSNGTASLTSVGEFKSTVLCPVLPMVWHARPSQVGESLGAEAAALPLGSWLDRLGMREQIAWKQKDVVSEQDRKISVFSQRGENSHQNFLTLLQNPFALAVIANERINLMIPYLIESVMTCGKSPSGCSLMARKSISACSSAAKIDWPRKDPDPSQPSQNRKPR